MQPGGGACLRVEGTRPRQDRVGARRLGSDQLLEASLLEAAMGWAPAQAHAVPGCHLPGPFRLCPD